jgi:ABC-2 type transport system ATP-binding protein
MSVEVTQLTKTYGAQNAIHELSFLAKKGEILGFLGPNGAGKTTTMKIITGYIPQTAGKAEVCGFDVEKEPLEVRKRIGYLPEHNPLYKEMYVREYLEFVASLHKTPQARKRVAEMIDMTGLEREQHKPIAALSKGYRQRVGLAQAMLHDPEVLILDEPTTGLDPNQLAEIRGLIKKLGAEKTLIFSTHIMQEVQAICNRVLIINRGKIVADDPIDQLSARIAGESQVTVEFAQATQATLLQKIKGVKSVRSLGEQRWQLSADTKADVRPEVFQFAVAQGLTLLEMHKETISVEDVFQKLTNQG